MVEVRPRTVEDYLQADGKSPYQRWFKTVKYLPVGRKIEIRLHRVEEGNLGDHKHVGEGVWELRIFGDAYRVYYGEDGDKIILLLGGSKASQDSDIAKAKEYWRDYNA